jgi:hypothetical protein
VSFVFFYFGKTNYFLGSEDNFIYLWRTSGPPPSLTVRNDRNHAWERVRAHQAVVSLIIF